MAGVKLVDTSAEVLQRRVALDAETVAQVTFLSRVYRRHDTVDLFRLLFDCNDAISCWVAVGNIVPNGNNVLLFNRKINNRYSMERVVTTSSK